jgi:hypothetical protein
LQEDFTELTQRETTVIAVAQEDTELAQHARFLKAFKTPPQFDIVADLNRKATSRYHRTTAYLIDKQGVVRQVFPMTIPPPGTVVGGVARDRRRGVGRQDRRTTGRGGLAWRRGRRAGVSDQILQSINNPRPAHDERASRHAGIRSPRRHGPQRAWERIPAGERFSSAKGVGFGFPSRIRWFRRLLAACLSCDRPVKTHRAMFSRSFVISFPKLT